MYSGQSCCASWNAAATQAAQVDALVSPRQSARPLAWAGAVPKPRVAKPAGETEALTGSAAARRFRFAWNVLLAAYLLPSQSEGGISTARGAGSRKAKTRMMMV